MQTRSKLHPANWETLLQAVEVAIACEEGDIPFDELADAYRVYYENTLTSTGKRGNDEDEDDHVAKRVRFNEDTTVDEPTGAEVTAQAHGMVGLDNAKEVPLAINEEAVTKGMLSVFALRGS